MALVRLVLVLVLVRSASATGSWSWSWSWSGFGPQLRWSGPAESYRYVMQIVRSCALVLGLG